MKLYILVLHFVLREFPLDIRVVMMYIVNNNNNE